MTIIFPQYFDFFPQIQAFEIEIWPFKNLKFWAKFCLWKFIHGSTFTRVYSVLLFADVLDMVASGRLGKGMVDWLGKVK